MILPTFYEQNLIPNWGISFYDYDTNQSVAVVKSSGIGMTISHDQKLAYKALKKELDKTFK